jgi:hypothetical protein
MEEDRELWLTIRRALLMVVDVIERVKLRLPPEKRTDELRKARRTQPQVANLP